MPELILTPPDHHSPGPGRHLRTDRRTHLPWRTLAGPVLHHASAAGLGALPHAHPESVPMRLRHPPRRRLTGGSGANAAREILKDLKKIGTSSRCRVAGFRRLLKEIRFFVESVKQLPSPARSTPPATSLRTLWEFDMSSLLCCDFGATPPGKRLCGRPTLGFTNSNLCSQLSAGQISGS